MRIEKSRNIILFARKQTVFTFDGDKFTILQALIDTIIWLECQEFGTEL